MSTEVCNRQDFSDNLSGSMPPGSVPSLKVERLMTYSPVEGPQVSPQVSFRLTGVWRAFGIELLRFPKLQFHSLPPPLWREGSSREIKRSVFIEIYWILLVSADAEDEKAILRVYKFQNVLTCGCEMRKLGEKSKK